MVIPTTNAQVDYTHPVRVDAVDFSQWLRENCEEPDYAIIKMDIEGAEYDVLEKLIADDTIRLIDELRVEFHQQMNEDISLERHSRLVADVRHRVHLGHWG